MNAPQATAAEDRLVDHFWPREGGWQRVRPIILLMLVPLTFAALLIPATMVDLAGYLRVSRLLIGASVFYALLFVFFGLLRQRLLGRRGEPIGISIIWYLCGALVAGFTIPAFGIFKQMILPMAGFPWDAPLAALDKALFLGTDPWRITHHFFGTVAATRFIDFCYSTIWMVMMYAFPAIVIALFRDTRLRVRLIGSWIASWVIVGGIGAYLLGSAGPVYYEHFIGPYPSFGEMNAQLADIYQTAKAQGIRINAIDFQPILLKAYGVQRYAPAGGISAMPSMHLAMAALFAVTGFHVHKIIGAIMLGFWLVIWTGSVHFGWHYATDGLLGAALLLGIWFASGKIGNSADRSST